MKEKFISKKFGAEAQIMIDKINAILNRYEAQGYDLSLRQLYYQLVSQNLVENTERSYKNVGCLVSDARLAGLIDWEMIKDRGREMLQNPHWDDPADFITNVAPQFRINLWDNQLVYVEVMVEKQALEGVLEPVCRELDIPFTANKGYSSSSALYEAGKRMYNKLRDEKEVRIIYLGDHDPSGIDMSRDVLDRLRQFAKFTDGDTITLDVSRIALNMDQIRLYRPPENPAKITDSRAAEYIRRFGHSSWELDAIEPSRLASLVRESVTHFMDVKQFEKDRKEEKAMRKKMTDFAKNYK